MADAFTLTFTPCCLEEVGATWGAEGRAAVRWQQGPPSISPRCLPRDWAISAPAEMGPPTELPQVVSEVKKWCPMGKETVLAGMTSRLTEQSWTLLRSLRLILTAGDPSFRTPNPGRTPSQAGNRPEAETAPPHPLKSLKAAGRVPGVLTGNTAGPYWKVLGSPGTPV